MKSIIHDITDPGEFLPEPTPLWQTWWFMLAVGLSLLILGIILYFIFRKQSQVRQRRSLLEKARARLDKLKAELDTEQPEPQAVAIRISLILRQYLEAAFNDPALFETNEEFTLRPHALSKLHPDSRTPITEHLTQLSQLKYAPSDDHDSISKLIDQAGEILGNIELNVTPVTVSATSETPPPLSS